VSILNGNLHVEAVDFHRWEGCWAGMLITPWFINFFLLPDDPASWTSIRAGEKSHITLPAGTFEIFGGEEPGLGPYRFFSLFAPVHQFSEQELARQVARESLKALLDPATAARIAPRPPEINPFARQLEEPPAEPETRELEEIRESASRPHNRRDFLRGAFLKKVP
jgi:[NiFe] hydrogenase assembly HybE family chaperone